MSQTSDRETAEHGWMDGHTWDGSRRGDRCLAHAACCDSGPALSNGRSPSASPLSPLQSDSHSSLASVWSGRHKQDRDVWFDLAFWSSPEHNSESQLAPLANVLRRRIFPTGFSKVIPVHLKRGRKAQRDGTEAVVVQLEVQKNL